MSAFGPSRIKARHADGFHFESGPSLYSGLSSDESSNPLKHIFQIIGEEPEWITYKRWGTFLPEGKFAIKVGPEEFYPMLAKYAPPGAKEQWDKIFEEEKEVLKRKKALKRRIRTTPFSTPRGKTRVPHDDEVEEGQLVEPTTPATPSYKDQLVKAM